MGRQPGGSGCLQRPAGPSGGGLKVTDTVITMTKLKPAPTLTPPQEPADDASTGPGAIGPPAPASPRAINLSQLPNGCCLRVAVRESGSRARSAPLEKFWESALQRNQRSKLGLKAFLHLKSSTPPKSMVENTMVLVSHARSHGNIDFSIKSPQKALNGAGIPAPSDSSRRETLKTHNNNIIYEHQLVP